MTPPRTEDGAAAEAARLRREVARLEAELKAERATKHRLRNAAVVCPECDQLVQLCPNTRAMTPHCCTPKAN